MIIRLFRDGERVDLGRLESFIGALPVDHHESMVWKAFLSDVHFQAAKFHALNIEGVEFFSEHQAPDGGSWHITANRG